MQPPLCVCVCVQVRAQITAAGLRVVGWYHSHPDFPSDPSVQDITAQERFQQVFKHRTGAEPFVGVIISPYSRGCVSVRIVRTQFFLRSLEVSRQS